jgi:hypothetical protein
MNISDILKDKIVKSLIEPYYYDDIDIILKKIKYYELVENIFEVVSKILVCLGSTLSFASGYYNTPILSFISGSFTTVSLATFQYSVFCSKQMKNNVIKLNNILKELNIKSIDIQVLVYMETRAKQKRKD